MIKQYGEMYTAEEGIRLMNQWGEAGQAFFFVIPYDCSSVFLQREGAESDGAAFFTPLSGLRCGEGHSSLPEEVRFEAFPVDRDEYGAAFDEVMAHLFRGDTYLLNLCFSTELRTNLSVADFFHHASSPYKLMLRGKEFDPEGDAEDFALACFSPEPFVRICEGVISTYPMKGTAPDEPGAAERLMGDEKERREHATIVDLMRNDLSLVSSGVEVARYRYLERVETLRGGVLQCSSEIRGHLHEGWRSRLGSLLMEILPAGSVTGAPKESTCRVIAGAEREGRGYYTGVFGYFDGKSLDSAVAIRYVERRAGRLVYRSGGGITVMSRREDEYEELIRKVYVPFSF